MKLHGVLRVGSGLVLMLMTVCGATAQRMNIPPLFVPAGDCRWSVFPSGGQAVRLSSHSICLGSYDGERSIEFTLPASWTLRPGTSSMCVVTRIGPSGTTVEPGARSLVYESADRAASLEATAISAGEFRLDWRASHVAALEGVRMCVRGMPDFAVPSSNSSLRWESAGGGDSRLVAASSYEGTLTLTQPLVYATFLGGSVYEKIYQMSLAADGTLVLAGSMTSLDFPSSPGAFDPIGDAMGDVFVAGMSPDGSSLTFATFFGGSDVESPASMRIDVDGSYVFAGLTYSADLPVTPGAFDSTKNGGEDSYIARLSADGTQLLACTYLGGNGIGGDALQELRIDSDGTVVVMGRTCAANFPTTPGSYQPSLAGSCDFTVARSSPDLSAVIAATYFGGTLNDFPYSMAVLPDGSVLISGNAANIPATMSGGAFAGAGPDADGILVRFSPDLTRVMWSTLVDGRPGFLTPKPDGSVVIFGGTNESDFPATRGAWAPTFGGSSVDADGFVCAITDDAQTLLWSTYIPLPGGIGLSDAALDAQGRVYLCGEAQSAGVPLTPDAFDTTFVGLSEGYVIVIDETGSNQLYGSYLGPGSVFGDEGAFALVPDGCAGVWVSGRSTSRSFPVTPDAFDPTYAGGGDAWILRITTDNRWTDLDQHLYSAAARPRLWPAGQLCAGEPTALDLDNGPDSGSAHLVIGAFDLSAPFKGGHLVPTPDVVVPGIPLDAQGDVSLAFEWPPGIPSSVDVYLQVWMPDSSAPFGFVASNAVRGTTP